MLTLLLGQDVFAKQLYIEDALKTGDWETIKISSDETPPALSSLSEPTLFGPAQAYIFDHCWKNLDADELLKYGADSPTPIFVLEDSIDKRKTVNQNILKNKKVTVKEFPVPQGGEAAGWLVTHAKELGIAIEKDAAQRLAQALAPDSTEGLPVISAHNELKKLGDYAGGKPVTTEMVEELVMSVVSINVFDLLDAIGSRQKPRAMKLLNDFFLHTDGDEKTKAIQVSALLADQLRNILLTQSAAAENISEQQLLADTGWKSGRLFVMRKLARGFTTTQVRGALSKLESLDMELKSSTMPPHVVLDLIIADM